MVKSEVQTGKEQREEKKRGRENEGKIEWPFERDEENVTNIEHRQMTGK